MKGSFIAKSMKNSISKIKRAEEPNKSLNCPKHKSKVVKNKKVIKMKEKILTKEEKLNHRYERYMKYVKLISRGLKEINPLFNPGVVIKYRNVVSNSNSSSSSKTENNNKEINNNIQKKSKIEDIIENKTEVINKQNENKEYKSIYKQKDIINTNIEKCNKDYKKEKENILKKFIHNKDTVKTEQQKNYFDMRQNKCKNDQLIDEKNNDIKEEEKNNDLKEDEKINDLKKEEKSNEKNNDLKEENKKDNKINDPLMQIDPNKNHLKKTVKIKKLEKTDENNINLNRENGLGNENKKDKNNIKNKNNEVEEVKNFDKEQNKVKEKNKLIEEKNNDLKEEKNENNYNYFQQQIESKENNSKKFKKNEKIKKKNKSPNNIKKNQEIGKDIKKIENLSNNNKNENNENKEKNINEAKEIKNEIDEVNKGVNKVNNDVEKINNDEVKINKEVEEINNEVLEINKEVEEINKEIKERSEINELNNEIEELNKKNVNNNRNILTENEEKNSKIPVKVEKVNLRTKNRAILNNKIKNQKYNSNKIMPKRVIKIHNNKINKNDNYLTNKKNEHSEEFISIRNSFIPKTKRLYSIINGPIKNEYNFNETDIKKPSHQNIYIVPSSVDNINKILDKKNVINSKIDPYQVTKQYYIKSQDKKLNSIFCTPKKQDEESYKNFIAIVPNSSKNKKIDYSNENHSKNSYINFMKKNQILYNHNTPKKDITPKHVNHENNEEIKSINKICVCPKSNCIAKRPNLSGNRVIHYSHKRKNLENFTRNFTEPNNNLNYYSNYPNIHSQLKTINGERKHSVCNGKTTVFQFYFGKMKVLENYEGNNFENIENNKVNQKKRFKRERMIINIDN